MQLNDTHLVLLSAAAQRDDKRLVLPGKLGQKAADKLAYRLEAAGLVEVVAVTAHQPQWGTSPDGEPIGLRITAAGLEAIGIERDSSPNPATQPADDAGRETAKATPPAEQVDGAAEDQPSPSTVNEAAREERAKGRGSSGEPSSSEVPAEGVSREEVSNDAVASNVVLPRAGSKRALLIAMLQRQEGASVEAIMAAMGWLPHSTRAALTGLRKAGHRLVKSKDAGTTIYRLIDPASADRNPVNDAAE